MRVCNSIRDCSPDERSAVTCCLTEQLYIRKCSSGGVGGGLVPNSSQPVTLPVSNSSQTVTPRADKAPFDYGSREEVKRQ